MAAITRTSLRMVVIAAHALELPLLQHAQQLHLHVRRQVADLVEEDRAAVGELETAFAGRDSAPVNAPRSWPNSSLSITESGNAATFTFTNGRSARGLL